MANGVSQLAAAPLDASKNFVSTLELLSNANSNTAAVKYNRQTNKWYNKANVPKKGHALFGQLNHTVVAIRNIRQCGTLLAFEF